MGCIEKKIREVRNSWSGHEKETRPPKRLVRIEDCHLEIWTEWIGVRTDEERGKRSICSILENTGAVKIRVHGELHKGPCGTYDNIIADIFIAIKYQEALVVYIKKACHPEGRLPCS